MSDEYQEVELFTSDGRFVTKARIPPFVKMPEMLMWGTRFFRLDGPRDAYEKSTWSIKHRYLEGLCLPY